MHAAVTTALCFLWALLFIGATVLFGFNARFWNKGQDQFLNTETQINNMNWAVLGYVLMITFALLFVLTLSAGNQGGHLKPPQASNVGKFRSET
jgi:hypothetical protein